jgi:DNA-binding response OmpR family regulator
MGGLHILILTATVEDAVQLTKTTPGAGDHLTITADPARIEDLAHHRPLDLLVIERRAAHGLAQPALDRLLRSEDGPALLIVDPPMPAALARVAQALGPLPRTQDVYAVGDLRVDTRRKRVGVGPHWTTLPPLEYRLILTLIRHPDEVVGYQELMRAVWGYEGDRDEARELLKGHIRQIRRRLGLDASTPQYIHAVRGFGYMLSAPERPREG